MDKQALIEAGKELLRLFLFSFVGVLIAYVGDLPQTETTAIALFVLRIVDKYIHEDKDINLKGLSPI